MRAKIVELKKISRHLLLSKYYTFTGALFIYFLADLAASLLPVWLFNGSDTVNVISRYAFTFLLSVFLGLLSIGITRLTWCTLKGEKCKLDVVFYAFKNNSDQFIKIELLFTAIKTALSFLALLLDVIDEKYTLNDIEYNIAYYTIIFAVLFITMLITLRLTWSIYILFDDPSLCAGAALKKSLELTRGKTFEILYLKLSFAGLYILGFLSMFSGFLFVKPYSEMASLLYYNRLAGKPVPELI